MNQPISSERERPAILKWIFNFFIGFAGLNFGILSAFLPVTLAVIFISNPHIDLFGSSYTIINAVLCGIIAITLYVVANKRKRQLNDRLPTWAHFLFWGFIIGALIIAIGIILELSPEYIQKSY